jgi:hypothetical protein
MELTVVTKELGDMVHIAADQDNEVIYEIK